MALSIFKKSPDTDVEQLRSRRASLAAKLDKARSNIQPKKDYVATLLIEDADPPLVARATKVVAEAIQDAEAHSDAIARLDAEIDRKTAEIAAAADRKQRDKTVAELEAHEARINAAGLHLVEALRNFAAASDPIVPTIWEARKLNGLAKQLAGEIPSATALVTSMVRHHIENVKLGTAPAALIGHPVSEAPAPKSQAIKKTRVFTLAQVRWREGQETKTANEHQHTEMPVDTANRAIGLDYIIAGDSERAKSLYTSYLAPPLLPALDCVDLDDPALKPRKPIFGADILIARTGLTETVGTNRGHGVRQ